MLVRRAVIAVGLSVALAGAGAGTAAAGTQTTPPGDGSSGLLDNVGKTLSSLTGGSSGNQAEQRSGGKESGESGGKESGESGGMDSGESGGSEAAHTQSADSTAANQTGGSSGGSGGESSDPAGDLPNLPGSGEGPLLDEQGLCADGSPQGNADSCASETLGNGYLNACIREDGGVVSQVGEATGLPEQAGLSCPTMKPPPGEKPRDDSEPTPMPPPLDRAQPAKPAEPIVAEPSFTG